MKTSTLPLAIATVAFGASTIYLAQRLKGESARVEKAALEVRDLNARISDLEKARAEPRFAGSGVLGGIDVAPGEAVSTLPPLPMPAGPESRADQHLEAVLTGPGKHPRGEAFQKMIRAQMRAQNKQMYVDVGAQLGLSKEDAAKLIDLLTDQQVSGMGFAGDATDPTERMRLMNEARRESDAKIAELIGPEKLGLLQEYQQTIPVRQELDMLARQLEGYDAAPMSDDQRKRLLAALLEERKRIPTPHYSSSTAREDFAKAYADWQDDYNARVAAQARGILNSEQYTVYDDYQQLQKEMRDQAQANMIGGLRGNVMFSTAPAMMMGETAIVTTTATSSSEEKAEEP